MENKSENKSENKLLGFGFMRLPLKDQNNHADVDMEILGQMVETFIENGFNYFDLAYVYHNGACESVFREAVANRYPREKYTVATKLPMFMLKNKEQQEQIFAEQLEKCGVDYFDYYMLHDLNVNTVPKTVEFESFDFIRKQKEAGKILHIGFSFHDSPEMLDDLLTKHPDVDFVQLQINYADWDNASIQSRKCYEIAKKHNKKIIIMEPLKGGTLANVPEEVEKLFKNYDPNLSIASWAIRFAASLDNVIMVLSGMSDFHQLKENVNDMKNFVPFSDREFEIVRQAVDTINESVKIPCTSCRYCVPVCPKNIAIPEYFSLYNAEQNDVNRGMSTHLAYYFNIQQKKGKPTDCIRCGKCEEICPQHLPIIEDLKAVSGEMDEALEAMLKMMS